MRAKLVQKVIVAALMAAGCNLASANAIVYQGVTFTATRTADTLTLKIDAAHPNGDWAGATMLGALQIGDVGKFTGFSFTSNVAGTGGWNENGQELNASGCAGGNQPDKDACIYGPRVALGDGMTFNFTFTGTAFDLSDPSVKVNFFADADANKKLGSLFSQNIVATLGGPPPTDVPEPQSLALLASGVGIMGALARRRKARKG